MKSTNIAGRRLVPSKVLAACRECDSMGVNAFLDRYGYGRARTWLLRANGRSYPSKAIVGVAAGLKASEFFGGVQGAVRALVQLGFEVRHVEGEIADPKLDCLRRLLVAEGLDVLEPEWPAFANQPTAYFASGSNQLTQIRAMGKAGVDVGVAVPNLTANGEAELLDLAGSDVQVFVDSGAFSEVSFEGGVRRVVKPMGVEEWSRVMGVYRRLAGLGSQLWIVAPDCVGDQVESLRRLGQWATELHHLRAQGVRVLVPVQKGDWPQADFALRVDAVLGGDWWIPAMPCAKAATTPEELDDFIIMRQPKHVHLLGLGVRNRKVKTYLAAAHWTSVSLDSCWLAANAGRGKKPRRLTRALDAAKKLLGRVGLRTSPVELSVYSCFAR